MTYGPRMPYKHSLCTTVELSPSIDFAVNVGKNLPTSCPESQGILPALYLTHPLHLTLVSLNLLPLLLLGRRGRPCRLATIHWIVIPSSDNWDYYKISLAIRTLLLLLWLIRYFLYVLGLLLEAGSYASYSYPNLYGLHRWILLEQL